MREPVAIPGRTSAHTKAPLPSSPSKPSLFESQAVIRHGAAHGETLVNRTGQDVAATGSSRTFTRKAAGIQSLAPVRRPHDGWDREPIFHAPSRAVVCNLCAVPQKLRVKKSPLRRAWVGGAAPPLTGRGSSSGRREAAATALAPARAGRHRRGKPPGLPRWQQLHTMPANC